MSGGWQGSFTTRQDDEEMFDTLAVSPGACYRVVPVTSLCVVATPTERMVEAGQTAAIASHATMGEKLAAIYLAMRGAAHPGNQPEDVWKPEIELGRWVRPPCPSPSP